MKLALFKIPSEVYKQEDYFPCILPYFNSVKLYNANLLQFADSTHKSDIQTYINLCNAYIDSLYFNLPSLPASPWRNYIPNSIAPSKPSTTGWPTEQVALIDNISDATQECYNVANDWIAFVVANNSPPTYLTNEQAWDIALNHYADLLIKQYNGKPNATRTIAFYAYWYLLNIRIGFDISRKNNPNFASGSQLDVIGSLFGLSRNLSFTDGQGNNYTTLTDSQFRIVIAFTIACSNCNFSYSDMARVIFKTFQGQVNVSSGQDMSLSYFIGSPIGSDIYVAIYAMLAKKSLPAPIGVGATFVTIAPDDRPFFALCSALDWENTNAIDYGFADTSNYDKGTILGYGNFIVK